MRIKMKKWLLLTLTFVVFLTTIGTVFAANEVVDPSFNIIAGGSEDSVLIQEDGTMDLALTPSSGFGMRANAMSLGELNQFDAKNFTITFSVGEIYPGINATFSLQTAPTGTIGAGNGNGFNLIMRKETNGTVTILMYDQSAATTLMGSMVGVPLTATDQITLTFKYDDPTNIAEVKVLDRVSILNGGMSTQKSRFDGHYGGDANYIGYLSFGGYYFSAPSTTKLGFTIHEINGQTPLALYKSKIESAVSNFEAAANILGSNSTSTDITTATNLNVFLDGHYQTLLNASDADGAFAGRIAAAQLKIDMLKPELITASISYELGQETVPSINYDSKGMVLSVKLGSNVLTGSDYTYIANDFKLKQSVLETLAAGDHSLELSTEAGVKTVTITVLEGPKEPVLNTTEITYQSKSGLVPVIEFINYDLAVSAKLGTETLAVTDYSFLNNEFKLKTSVLDALAVGTHTLELSTQGGTKSVTITVLEAAKEPVLNTPTMTYQLGSGNITPIEFLNYELDINVKLTINPLAATDYTYVNNQLLLKQSLLESLSPGTHTLVISTAGGSKNVSILVVAAPREPELSTASITYQLGTSSIPVIGFVSHELAVSAKIGSKVLTASDYTYQSNQFKLKQSVLEALAVGTHTLELSTPGGMKPVTITITAAAVSEPMDTSSNALWITLGSIAGLGLIGVGVFFIIKKKKII